MTGLIDSNTAKNRRLGSLRGCGQFGVLDLDRVLCLVRLLPASYCLPRTSKDPYSTILYCTFTPVYYTVLCVCVGEKRHFPVSGSSDELNANEN